MTIKALKKKSTQLSGNLDATHEMQELRTNIHILSQEINKKFNLVDFTDQIDKEKLKYLIDNWVVDLSKAAQEEDFLKGLEEIVEKLVVQLNKGKFQELDDNFPNLVKELNFLKTKCNELANIKKVAYQQRYTKAKETVPLPLTLILRYDIQARKRDKELFIQHEQALDNTEIIKASIHEATLFKVGALYALYLHDVLTRRVVEMSIALREDDLPDRFKYIEEEGKLRKARWMELAKQAYDEMLSDPNLDTQQRFTASCEKFKKIYLGLRHSKQVNLEAILDNAMTLPEVPDTLFKNSLSDADEILFFKPSTRSYVNFTGDELSILKDLIPEHKKSRFKDLIPEHSTEFFIPAIGGISLDEFMRICLSRQKHIKDTKGQEMRKRTAAIQFLFKVQEVVHEAHRSLQEDMVGKQFDTNQGYVSWKAEPENLYAEISKLFQHNQKEQLITEDCHLSGPELTEKFFVKVFAKLDSDVNEKIEKNGCIKEIPKSKREQEKKRIVENYPPRIKMQAFKKIVDQVGAENIKIFGLPDFGVHPIIVGKKVYIDERQGPSIACYSVPKDSLVNEATFTAEPATAPTKTGWCG